MQQKILLLTLICSGFLTSTTDLSGQPTFLRHTIASEIRGAYWVHIVDVDNDGDLDLVTASFDGIFWWENDGQQNFTRRTVGGLTGAWSAHGNDIDGDGDIDILGASPTTDEVALWKNDGSENFNQKEVVDGSGQDPETVWTADVDGDQDIDILVAHWEDGDISWYENRGTSFVKRTVDSDLKGAHSVAAADLDSDGHMDLLASGSNMTRWYQNDGNQNFTKKSVGDFGALCVHPADLDNDGDPDILRTQRDNGDLDWFENKGGTFVEHTIEAGFSDSWSVRTGDIDGDGDIDVVAAGFSANNIKVWLNDGAQNFGAGFIVEEVSVPRFVDVRDMDGDGDDDIAAAIRDARDIVWYETEGAPPSLSVLSPVAGDTIIAEQNYEVAWQFTNVIDSVGVEFSADNGVSWSTLSPAVQNTGSFSWSVTDTSSDQCLIRVYDVKSPTFSDTSGLFSIKKAGEIPQILVLFAPNGSEELLVNSVFEITWGSSSNILQVDIEFSINDGLNWLPVALQYSNSGSFSWTVPDMPSQTCLIRISDSEDSEPSDTSDASFSIVKPPQIIDLVQPNGGELLIEGSEFKIQWTTSGDVDSIDIEFTQNNGLSWNTIVAGMENIGSFPWTVPAIVSDSCLVRVSDASDGQPSDTSASLFKIRTLDLFVPIITFFEPRQGPPGTVVTIHGTNFIDVNAVALEGKNASFTVESEESITAVVPASAASGSFTVTNFAGEGESDESFQIVGAVDTTEFIILPTDDAQVKVTDPTKNYGDKTSFKVELDQFKSYLKFNVTGLNGPAISAFIRVVAVNGSDSGGKVHPVSNMHQGSQALWAENGLTFENAPLIDVLAISSFGPVALGDTSVFEVTDVISGNGVFSFALQSESSDLVEYSSKEGPFAPQLIVTGQTTGNLKPFAEDDSLDLLEDTPSQLSILQNDFDPDGEIDSTSVAILAAPIFGVASVDSSGRVLYTPAGHYFGVDSLAYSVTDDSGESSNAGKVFLRISAVNDPPVAADDDTSLAQGSSISIDLLRNDFDVDGILDPASIEIISAQHTNASVSLDSSSGRIFYRPHQVFSGLDSLIYTVKDDSGAVSNQAKVKIDVLKQNQPPVARDDAALISMNDAADIDVLANDTDPEEMLDVTTVSVQSGPSNGEVFVHVLSGLITYMPQQDFVGQDSLTYTVQDTGAVVSNPATVRILVHAPNQGPVIDGFQPNERELRFAAGDTVDFALFVSDADGDSLSYRWFLTNPIEQVDSLVSVNPTYQFHAADWPAGGYQVKGLVADHIASDSTDWLIDIVTSVNLSLYTVNFIPYDGAVLQWRTSREVTNIGFNVLRSPSARGPFAQINDKILPARKDGLYSFTDGQVQAGNFFYYALEDVDVNGRRTRHETITLDISVPETFSLSQNFPNPFNPETRIRFQMAGPGRALLQVFDLTGREVATLLKENLAAGFYDMKWDGTDDRGLRVSTGIYYYRLTAGAFKETKRMLLLK